MIALEIYAKLTETTVSEFKDKSTSLTQGQKEASTLLWSFADGYCKISVWEFQPGHFTADRRAVGEYCHILSGRTSVTNADDKGTRDVVAGDLLVLPQGWTGEWLIH